MNRRTHPRTLLFRHVQQFLESYLANRFPIGSVQFEEAELAPKEYGRRQKLREQLIGHFGGVRLMISSSNEAPPLGSIKCIGPHGEVEGPMDDATWRRVAAFIEGNGDNGDRGGSV